MRNILLVIAFSVIYIFVFIFLNNYSLLYTTLFSAFPLEVKGELFISVFTGIGSTMSFVNFLTLLVIAILTAVNMLLISKRIAKMKSYGSMNIVVGGSSLLGLVSSGCASCGLPLLTFLGLGSSVGLLPLKGYEFSLITIILLSISSFVLIKQLREKPACEIPTVGVYRTHHLSNTSPKHMRQ